MILGFTPFLFLVAPKLRLKSAIVQERAKEASMITSVRDILSALPSLAAHFLSPQIANLPRLFFHEHFLLADRLAGSFRATHSTVCASAPLAKPWH